VPGGGGRWPARWGGGGGSYTMLRVLLICRETDGINSGRLTAG
jgi:hypothetical protein